MNIYGPEFLLDETHNRISVAGTSGAGKTTLCTHISDALGYPYTEIDSLYHGPGWEPRAEFSDDVAALIDANRWVVEWQYTVARPSIALRSQVMIWLDLPVRVRMLQLLTRSVSRWVNGTELWNGNREPGLKSWFTRGDENILWWGWSTRHKFDDLPDQLHALGAHGVEVVRLRTRREVRLFVANNGLRSTANRRIFGDRV